MFNLLPNLMYNTIHNTVVFIDIISRSHHVMRSKIYLFRFFKSPDSGDKGIDSRILASPGRKILIPQIDHPPI